MTDPSKNLHDLMAQIQINTIEQLSDRSGISVWYLFRIEGGLIDHIPLEICLKLAETLEVSLGELVQQLSLSGGSQAITPCQDTSAKDWQREYEKLKQQWEQQEQNLIHQWQAQSLDLLEPWLLQWPTASTIAKNSIDMPAVRLLPLIKPLERLVATWGLVPIGKVGELVDYDPTCHELLDGATEPGTMVIIRYIGYRQNDRLWCRAKVSIPEDEAI